MLRWKMTTPSHQPPRQQTWMLIRGWSTVKFSWMEWKLTPGCTTNMAMVFQRGSTLALGKTAG